MSLLTRVFVYGTLLPGCTNEHVARSGGPYTSESAWLDGHALYSFSPEGYPGLRPGDGRVHGMVYTYAPHDWARALPLLDELEEVELNPPTYHRITVTVATEAGPAVAWTYLYARPERLEHPGARHLASGRWQS